MLEHKAARTKIVALLVVGLFLLSGFAFLGMWSSATGSNPYNCATKPPTLPPHVARVLNIKFTAINDEDSGLHGYWAMDRLNENVQVFLLPNSSWYLQQTFSGVFMTVQGAISPGAGMIENQSSYGAVNGYVAGSFEGSFNAHGLPVSGNLGIVNIGGTTAAILANQDASTNSSYFWQASYFGGASPGSDPAPYYSLLYTLNGRFSPATGFSMCQSSLNNVQGDILA